MKNYIYPLSVRCPVPYCDSEPHRKCCNRLGFILSNAHKQRQKAARLATEEKYQLTETDILTMLRVARDKNATSGRYNRTPKCLPIAKTKETL